MLKFKSQFIPFRETGKFSNLVQDYSQKAENLNNFYQFYPDIDGFNTSIENYGFENIDRNVLVAELMDQYHNVPTVLPCVRNNINLLKSPHTFTVTTGHQLNIFSGPLFFHYKILTTICLAEKLKQKFPQKNFVPVYWMASEDHDIDEIDHFSIFNKTFTFNTDYKGRAGKVPLTAFSDLLSQLKEIIGTSEISKKLFDDLSSCYQNSNNLALATRLWTNHLYGKYGLVILDPDSIALKQKFIPFLKEEAFNRTSFSLVNKTIELLKKDGYESQVHPREINLFYVDETRRERIVVEDNVFKILNTDLSFSFQEFDALISNHPEKLSPNVVTRPLYQQLLLPNLAYIGGPAEIAYWMEYKSLFQHHKLNFPVLVMRNCFLIVDKQEEERRQKFNFSIKDLFDTEENLIKKFISFQGDDSFSLDDVLNQFHKPFIEISEWVGKFDASLIASVETEKQKMINGIRHLEQKVIRAKKKKSETEVMQIRRLKDKLFPGQVLQERTETILPFLIRYDDTFLDALKEVIDPFRTEFSVILAEE